MSVIRYEPFRDPFERLISMAATGTRAPLGMPGTSIAPRTAATTSRLTCLASTLTASR